MKKLINFFIFLFLFGFCTIVLGLTLRGLPGNPSEDMINTRKWKEDGPFELSPERGRFALTMNLAEHRSVYFNRKIAQFIVPDLGYTNGRYVSLFAPGISILALPLYNLGKIFDLPQVFSFALSSLFALGNLILIVSIIKRLTNNIYAGWAAALTFLFGTVAWSYATTLYQHHGVTFLILSAVYLLTAPTSWLTGLLVGFLFGFSIFIEFPTVVFFIPLMIWLVVRHIHFVEKENQIEFKFRLTLILVVLGFIIGLAPLLAYNRQVYGKSLEIAQLTGLVRRSKTVSIDPKTGIAAPPRYEPSLSRVPTFFRLDNLPNSMDVLLTSKDRGLFWFSPVMILSLLGIKPLFKKNRLTAIGIGATLCTILALYGMWADPWGGWAFGPRYLIPVFALSSIFLGIAINTYGKKLLFLMVYFITLFWSVLVSLSGALTTSKIPPSVEVDSKYFPSFTYFYNMHLVTLGKSGSFIYNTYLSPCLTLEIFSRLLLTFILLAIVTCFFAGKKNLNNK